MAGYRPVIIGARWRELCLRHVRAVEGAPAMYVLLSDGTTAQIRQAAPGDFDAVKAMHEEMSPDNAYLRFFSLNRGVAEREARRICREPGPDHAALLALYEGKVAGVVGYEVADAPDEAGRSAGQTAEVAFAVADAMHRKGIATLLLESLVSLARARQLTAFTADTLGENTDMLRVFRDIGLPVITRREKETVVVTIPLPPDDTGTVLDEYLDSVALREGSADVASLRPVFAPGAVAVVGASRRQGTVGRSVLDNIRKGGYQGKLYAVNPNASEIAGQPCFPDVRSLPEPADLAILAVPPQAVPGVAAECGERGVKGLVVLTAGLDPAQSADLLAACRRHGMRLIGPNCFGIAVPAIGLDATFAATIPVPGAAGLVMQSGGLGFAMAEHLSRLGIGISSFASVGNKLDVS
jgi:predicted CoA-binding protein/GNAT superfamily N-acetyltransferase